MKIAVVTPYYREAPAVFGQMLRSVAAQTHPCRHFVVADGFPSAIATKYDIEHIVLPNAHGDNGNFARHAGAVRAIEQGYDAVSFLDADNWLRNDHVATIARTRAATGAAVVTTGRSLHRPDGSTLYDGVGFRWEEHDFVDTSCLTFFREAFPLNDVWRDMPRELGPISDRVMWRVVISRGMSVAHAPEPTVCFRTLYEGHYTAFNERPPPLAKGMHDAEAAWAFLEAMPEAERNRLAFGPDAEDSGAR